MEARIKRLILHKILPVLILLVIWEISACIYDKAVFFPSVHQTFFALVEILKSEEFLKVVYMTFTRVLCGLFYGTLSGCAFAILSYKVKFIHSIMIPLLSVIKATPIASIIILLYISPLNGNAIAILISFLIVFPIVWQNVYDAFNSIDKDLIEVAKIYEFSFIKKLKFLILPELKKFIIPATVTSIGLAFKAEIAAEIIAGVNDSIGQMIYYAKDVPAADRVFAWTIIGILLSILVEWCAKKLLIRTNEEAREEIV